MSPWTVGEDPSVVKDEPERDEGITYGQVLQEPEHLTFPVVVPLEGGAYQCHVQQENGAGDTRDRCRNIYLSLVEKYVIVNKVFSLFN